MASWVDCVGLWTRGCLVTFWLHFSPTSFAARTLGRMTPVFLWKTGVFFFFDFATFGHELPCPKADKITPQTLQEGLGLFFLKNLWLWEIFFKNYWKLDENSVKTRLQIILSTYFFQLYNLHSLFVVFNQYTIY